MHTKILETRQQIAALDDNLVAFAKELGDLEETLHAKATDEKTLKNLDGIITKRKLEFGCAHCFVWRI